MRKMLQGHQKHWQSSSGNISIHEKDLWQSNDQLSAYPALNQTWCTDGRSGIGVPRSCCWATNRKLEAFYLVFLHFVLLCTPLSQSSPPRSAGCLGNSKGPPKRTLWKGKCRCVNMQVCGEYEKTSKALLLSSNAVNLKILQPLRSSWPQNYLPAFVGVFMLSFHASPKDMGLNPFVPARIRRISILPTSRKKHPSPCQVSGSNANSQRHPINHVSFNSL